MDNSRTLLIRRYQSAQELPPAWDDLAQVYFQKRAFLAHADQYNPCRQRYYLAFDGKKVQAAAVVYTLAIDLFTFSNIPSPVRMSVIGLPASISPPGIFGEGEGIGYLIKHLLQVERGLILGLNLPPETDTHRGLKMRMLPTVELAHSFHDWETYLDGLRSPYRRRCCQILERSTGLQIQQSSCQSFSQQHYELYLQVLKRSSTCLETLRQGYFENLPDNFYLTTYYKEGEMLCWHINCRDEDQDRLYFFFGGNNYRFNHIYETYFNNLLGVLREAIEEGYSHIDFGQTAEIPKMRLGGQIVPKALFIYHRNTFFLYLLKQLKRFLEYRRVLPAHRVFKQTYLS